MLKRNMSIGSSNFSAFFVSNNGKIITSNTIQPSQAMTNSDIYAVISRISSNIAAMKIKADDQNVQNVINKPSTILNSFSFWQKCVTQMLLTGNTYVYIQREGGVPVGLTQIPADEVTINILSKAAGDEVDDAIYTITLDTENGRQIQVPSRDILHFRCLVTGSDAQTNGFTGISPLVSLAQEVTVQDTSRKLAIAALSHAISPSFVLKIPTVQVSEQTKEKFRSNFEKMTSGSNAGRAIVLDSSMDVEPLQINPDVDKLLSNTEFTQNQIAKAFNIPSEYLNGQGNQQSSITEMASLYVNALSLYINPILSELRLKFGCDITTDFSSIADVDHQQLISNVVSLSTSKSPVLSPEVATAVLKNVDALGLNDIDQSLFKVPAPPKNNKGDDNDE
ncbi:phage portal protein [Lactobacillus reuteri]|uniref:Phage portal protein n=1 Tax=Limosilactobacillus reuteri TaxID=1598 RepID=A0AAW9ZIE7_LIMRT|nr:phage portal protein [Limosilactobacillus reuteri]NME21795.1 phage portal protein [Limosilactobacillus reuteri]